MKKTIIADKTPEGNPKNIEKNILSDNNSVTRIVTVKKVMIAIISESIKSLNSFITNVKKEKKKVFRYVARFKISR